MNFNTRTVLDLMIIDPDLELILNALVDAEKSIYYNSGKTSQNEFVRYVIPLVKDELNFYISNRTYRLNLSFLKKCIDLDQVDYYHLITAVCKI
jgi:hypothetical protein